MKESLKMILRNNMERYNELAEQSRNEVLSELAPGATAPSTGKLHTDMSRRMMASFAKTSKEKAFELIDKEIDKTNRAIAAAPSTEAINTLTALSLSKSKDKRDYEAIYSTYGSNPQTARALNSIAKENEVAFFCEPAEFHKLDELQSCRRTFESVLDPNNIENMSAGRVRFIEMNIDEMDI